jgi:hypothetical protein
MMGCLEMGSYDPEEARVAGFCEEGNETYFVFHKMRGIYCVTEELLASRDRHCFVQIFG